MIRNPRSPRHPPRRLRSRRAGGASRDRCAAGRPRRASRGESGARQWPRRLGARPLGCCDGADRKRWRVGSSGPNTSSSGCPPAASRTAPSHRLAAQQDLRDPVEALALLAEDRAGALVGASMIRRTSSSISRRSHRSSRLARELASEERHSVSCRRPRTELLVIRSDHHLLGRRGDLLEVVGRPGRDLAEDDSSRHGAERHRHRVEQLGAGRQETILRRHRNRVAEGSTAGDHRDLVDRIGELEVVPTIACPISW